MRSASEFRLYTPRATDDAELLADWLEIEAIRSENGIGQLRELARAIGITGTEEDNDSPLNAGDFVDARPDVSDELQKRAEACAGAYPFQLDSAGTGIRLTPSWEIQTYTWLLLLSRFPANGQFGRGTRRLFHARMFESLSLLVAQRYLGGEECGARAFHFAWPRPDKSNFKQALNGLAAATRGRLLNRSDLRPGKEKDDGLDVFVWKPFKDPRCNYVGIFGQCAGGGDWDVKAPVPPVFLGKWISLDSPHLLPALFVPRMLSVNAFIGQANGALIFDRCRIASLMPDFQELGIQRPQFTTWMTSALAACGCRAHQT